MRSWLERNDPTIRWTIGRITDLAFLVFAILGAFMMIRMIRYWDETTAQNKQNLAISRQSLKEQQETNSLLRGLSAKLGASGHPTPADMK